MVSLVLLVHGFMVSGVCFREAHTGYVCWFWVGKKWDIGTLGNTLSGCVTQDPRVGPSESCAIHPTHSVHMVACKTEALVLYM